jgi:hypothetical protein
MIDLTNPTPDDIVAGCKHDRRFLRSHYWRGASERDRASPVVARHEGDK